MNLETVKNKIKYNKNLVSGRHIMADHSNIQLLEWASMTAHKINIGRWYMLNLNILCSTSGHYYLPVKGQNTLALAKRKL